MALLDVARTAPKAFFGGHRDNAALASLSPNALGLLLGDLNRMEVEPGRELWYEAGEPARIFFPRSGVISIVTHAGDSEIEVANIGPECCVMAKPGTRGVALTYTMLSFMRAPLFANIARQDDDVRRLADRANDWLLTQARQFAACNAKHGAEKRFCRWLLQMSDHNRSDWIIAIQADIADLLGVRRTTITNLAWELQAAGFISYRRGKIEIRDRVSLRNLACDCYDVLSPLRSPFAPKCEVPG